MDIKQFSTFRIDQHLFGIDVLIIREINQVLDITPVPHAPEYVLGLVNLRGEIVVVFDLGIRLNFKPRKITAHSHNVVLKGDQVGLLVDGIYEVVQVESGEIVSPPANVGQIEGKFIEGVVKLTGELLTILSADEILKYDTLRKKAGRHHHGELI